MKARAPKLQINEAEQIHLKAGQNRPDDVGMSASDELTRKKFKNSCSNIS